MRIFIFIHAYTTPRGVDILHQELERIKASGLYDAATNIYIGAVGNNIDPNNIDPNNIDPNNIDPKVLYSYSPDPLLYEGFTLTNLYKKACVVNKSDAILYIHTKGASYGDRLCEQPAVDSWREHMLSIAVDRWQECVSELEKHSTCGPYGHRNPEPFYAGNFWWARAGYLAKLMPPFKWAANVISRGGQARWSYETFVIQGNMTGHKFLSEWPF